MNDLEELVSMHGMDQTIRIFGSVMRNKYLIRFYNKYLEEPIIPIVLQNVGYKF